MTLLKDFSYFQTGGSCKYLFLPKNLEELKEAQRIVYKEKLRSFVLGGGSNSLVMDEDWDGAVIVMHAMQHLDVYENTIISEAGIANDKIVEKAFEKNLGGLAWMYGLPGLIGGTVRMNARCYGGEISQVVSRIFYVDEKGNSFSIDIKNDSDRKKIFSGYKETIFMKNPWIVHRVEFSLFPTESMQIQEKMQACRSDRENKKQYIFPSCGCVFKNDYREEVSIPSGFLLDQAGAKNFSVGKAQVSPHHANFVYNQGASSREILQLTFLMREAVYKKFGIWLSYEMEALGAIPEDMNETFFELRRENPNKQELERARALWLGR